MSPRGPGKYDDAATLVRNRTMAAAVVVIVLGGSQGSGFSVQADEETTRRLPDLLEDVAKEIRASLPKDLES